jgi:hypothetical protein
VIQKSQVMPLILARCPGVKTAWEKHQELWQSEEDGIFNDLGEFGTFIVDAYARQDLEPVAAAFVMVEELPVEGDKDVRTAAAIGFLEKVRNVASWRPFGSAAFLQSLGPKSKEARADANSTPRGRKGQRPTRVLS